MTERIVFFFVSRPKQKESQTIAKMYAYHNKILYD